MSNDNSADLPLPPQGSELHSRLNAGNGTVNIYHQWIPISSHTAKCDLCLEHNKSVCQRCSSCNRQLCRKCIHTARDDGVHNFKDSDLDWTPAAPVKRGPRAPLMSTASLSITGRPARPPTARSGTKFKVYKPSAPLVPSWDRFDRAPSGSPAPSPGAGRARRSGTKRASGIKPGSGADDLVPAGGRPSVRLPVRSSGTKRVRSDEEESAPSTPKKLKRNEGPSTQVPSPKSGNSFFPKPVTPQASGRVTIRINSDKIVQTASDTKTTQSSGAQTATTSSSTTTSTSATTSSSSANETSVTTSSSATALSSATSMSSFHNGNGNGKDGDDSNDDRRRHHTKVPATKDTIVKDFAVENFALDNSVDDDLASKDFVIKAVPTKDAPVQVSTVQKSAVKGPKNPRGKTKEALEKEERDKKNAWENNQILLDLRQSGQDDDARDMLEGAYALLDLSMGR